MPKRVGFAPPNWTMTPNVLFESLPNLDPAALKVTLIVLRHTVGFHRRSCRISITEMEELTGLSRQGVVNGADFAVNEGWIDRVNDGGVTVWTIVLIGQSGRVCPLCGFPEHRETDAGLIRLPFRNHHIVPLDRGGKDDPKNVIAICTDCQKRIMALASKREDENSAKLSARQWKGLLGSVLSEKLPPHMGGQLVNSVDYLDESLVNSVDQSGVGESTQLHEVVNSVDQSSQLSRLPSIKESIKESSKEKESSSSGDLFREWEKTVGPITKAVADDLIDMAEEMEQHRETLPSGVAGADIDGYTWIRNAVVEARKSATGRFNVRYVEAIINRWRTEGYQRPRDELHESDESGVKARMTPPPDWKGTDEEWISKVRREARQKIRQASEGDGKQNR